jgi:hypothetical protein
MEVANSIDMPWWLFNTGSSSTSIAVQLWTGLYVNVEFLLGEADLWAPYLKCF